MVAAAACCPIVTMLLDQVLALAKVVGIDARAVLVSATGRPDFPQLLVSFARGVRVGFLGHLDGVDVRDAGDGIRTDAVRDFDTSLV